MFLLITSQMCGDLAARAVRRGEEEESCLFFDDVPCLTGTHGISHIICFLSLSFCMRKKQKTRNYAYFRMTVVDYQAITTLPRVQELAQDLYGPHTMAMAWGPKKFPPTI